MNAMSRMSPPHPGHATGNSSPTRAVGARPRGLPPAPRADPVGRLVPWQHVADATDAAVCAIRLPLQEGQTPRPLRLSTGRAGHPWPRPAGQPMGTPRVPMAAEPGSAGRPRQNPARTNHSVPCLSTNGRAGPWRFPTRRDQFTDPKASTSTRVGQPRRPPNRVHLSEAAMQANRAAASTVAPSAKRSAKAP